MRGHVLAAALIVTIMGWAGAVRAEEAIKKADPVGSETCLGCHSGQETYKKNVHAKGLVNAKGIALDKQCETCHGNGSLHAGAGGDKSNPDFFTIKNPAKMKGDDQSKACLQCHSGANRTHFKGGVHEMKGVGCASCHSLHDTQANNGRAPLLKKGTELQTCYQCHADKKAQLSKSGHMPLVEGKMACSGCHNAHGGNDKMLVKGSVTHTCYTCHQDKRGPFLREHAPVRENCLSCHAPHGSHHEKMLVAKVPMLCQRCHQLGSHPTNAYGATQLNAENPRNFSRGCQNCHSRIHGSNHPSGKYFER